LLRFFLLFFPSLPDTRSPGSSEAEMPIRLGATWGDKFADKLPEWLWPRVRLVYFVFAPAFLALALIGLGRMLTRAPAHYPRHF
jgi:hypothetical protein